MGVAEDNLAVYIQEAARAFEIVQQNRHRSVPPYDWFGPDPEPRAAGSGCGCGGCKAADDDFAKHSIWRP